MADPENIPPAKPFHPEWSDEERAAHTWVLGSDRKMIPPPGYKPSAGSQAEEPAPAPAKKAAARKKSS